MKEITKYFLERKSLYSRYSDIVLDIPFEIKKKLNDSVSIIKLYSSKFINYTVKTSLNKHFKKILELILKIEEDDDNPPDSLMFCLNETDKLRKEILNKYARYLDKKQKEIEEKKISIIETDIKNKLISYRLNMMSFAPKKSAVSEYEETIVEERHRSR